MAGKMRTQSKLAVLVNTRELSKAFRVALNVHFKNLPMLAVNMTNFLNS